VNDTLFEAERDQIIADARYRFEHDAEFHYRVIMAARVLGLTYEDETLLGYVLVSVLYGMNPINTGLSSSVPPQINLSAPAGLPPKG
jgi:hypothetical protein